VKPFLIRRPPKIDFDAESPMLTVEAKDLVVYNTGPLTELENLDRG
jgi:hypothetical protein